MKKSELYDQAITLIRHSKMPSNKLMKQIRNKMDYTLEYKKQIYSFKSEKVVCLENDKSCLEKIKTFHLSGKVKSSRSLKYIFGVLDYKDEQLIITTYCYEVKYIFKKSILECIPDLYVIGVDVHDLKSNLSAFVFQYLTCFNGTYWISKYDFWIKKKTNSICQVSFAEKKYELLRCLRYVFCTSSVKRRFFKYISMKSIKADFMNSFELIEMCKALYMYPKLETIYKMEKYKWTSYKIDFFKSVSTCLRKRVKFEKYNYALMKDVYSNSVFDFNYYRVGIVVGRKNVENDNCLNSTFLRLPKKYQTFTTYNYLKKVNDYTWYIDYLKMALELDVNLSLSKNLYPKNLKKEHDDLSLLITQKRINEDNVHFKEINQKYDLLEFSTEEYRFHLPLSSFEFKCIGDQLKICLFSAHYDKRYLEKKSIILLVNHLEKKSLSYRFVAELNKNLDIIQLHGFRNDSGVSPIQIKEREKVKKILLNRLEMLKMTNGVIQYKNNNFQSIGKEKERSVII